MCTYYCIQPYQIHSRGMYTFDVKSVCISPNTIGYPLGFI